MPTWTACNKRKMYFGNFIIFVVDNFMTAICSYLFASERSQLQNTKLLAQCVYYFDSRNRGPATRYRCTSMIVKKNKFEGRNTQGSCTTIYLPHLKTRVTKLGRQQLVLRSLLRSLSATRDIKPPKSYQCYERT